MVFEDGMTKEFEWTKGERNPQARGARFEIIVQRIFEQHRFRVVRNPCAASPRQTDLMAARGDEQYLIEAKWQGPKRPVSDGDIDSLYARLGRTPPDVVGVFFSMSGYSKKAIGVAVERRKEHPTLLFGPDEIKALVGGEANLISLLHRKKRALTVHGRVFLSTGDGLWDGEPPPDRALLPQPEYQIWRADTEVSPWLACSGGFNGPVFTFTCQVLIYMSPPFLGPGVELNLPLGIHSERELAYVFNALREAGWITSAGWWSIRQMSTEWHGAGATGLLEAIERRDERYKVVNTKLHDSEEITYADVCEGRFYTLYAYIYVGRGEERGSVLRASLSARLPGIPVDPSPLRELIHAFELDDLIYFRPIVDDEERSVYARLDWGKYRLEPVALLCLPNQTWVTGIVVRNPFVGEVPGDVADKDILRVQEVLKGRELLVCRLSDWHEVGDEVDYYYLTSIDMALTDDARIVEATARWNDLVKRIHPLSDEEKDPILDDQESTFTHISWSVVDALERGKRLRPRRLGCSSLSTGFAS